MFARVITAQAGAEGFDGVVRLAGQQLPGARQQPGFGGYCLLTDAGTATRLHRPGGQAMRALRPPG